MSRVRDWHFGTCLHTAYLQSASGQSVEHVSCVRSTLWHLSSHCLSTIWNWSISSVFLFWFSFSSSPANDNQRLSYWPYVLSRRCLPKCRPIMFHVWWLWAPLLTRLRVQTYTLCTPVEFSMPFSMNSACHFFMSDDLADTRHHSWPCL